MPLRKSTSVITLFILCLGANRLNAQEPTSEVEAPPSSDRQVAVENVIDDQAIERRLSKILQSRERYDEVEVRVENGIVSFDGQSKSDEDRQWVESLAERTEGVVVVDNQIEVQSAVDLEGNLQVIQQSLSALWRDFLIRLPLMFAALVVIIITAVAAKIVGSVVHKLLSKRRRLRSSLKDLIHQLATLTVWIIGIVVAAVIVFPGLTPAKALTVLGLGSVAIGFAFKDIFENFFAGVLILWRYPLDRGDFIQCDDVVGHVEEITVRNTMLRRLDGELTVIPNAHLFKSNVDVLTNRGSRRVRIVAGVAYDTDVAEARQVIQQAVKQCSSIEKNREVEVYAQEFASSSINFEVAWWTGAKPVDIRASRDEVVAAIKAALDAAAIEIPFPYRTLTFKEPLRWSGRPPADANQAQTVNN